MPRTARTRSGSGIYHVMLRGVNRQDIFLDYEDASFYLELLRKLSSETNCSIYAFCLMRNHVHLLLKEAEDGQVSKLMHRLGTAFVLWYNCKYERVGHLFQGRFASETVEDDRYFLTVLRYIHQNPVKAGLVDACVEYRLSSYHAYDYGFDPYGIVEVDFAVGIAGSFENLLSLINLPDGDAPQPLQIPERAPDDELKALLVQLCADQTVLTKMAKSERDQILRRLKALGCFTLTQIARVTGIPRATVGRA